MFSSTFLISCHDCLFFVCFFCSYKRSAALSQFVMHRGLIISVMQVSVVCVGWCGVVCVGWCGWCGVVCVWVVSVVCVWGGECSVCGVVWVAWCVV